MNRKAEWRDVDWGYIKDRIINMNDSGQYTQDEIVYWLRNEVMEQVDKEKSDETMA